MAQKFTLTYYSDILCIWAHISQERVDEVSKRFLQAIVPSPACGVCRRGLPARRSNHAGLASPWDLSWTAQRRVRVDTSLPPKLGLP